MGTPVPADYDPFAEETPVAKQGTPVPADYDPFAAGPMSAAMPEISPEGFPTGQTLPPQPMHHSSMGYGESVGNAVAAFPTGAGRAANRVAANLPFADRLTAKLMETTGTGDYASNLEKVRAYDVQQKKEHPTGEMAASVAGAMLPVGGAVGTAAKGAGLLARTVRGGVMGGALGGAQGVSDVQDLSRLPSTDDVMNVLKHTGIGAGIGAAIPVAGAGVGAAYRKVADALTGRVPGMGKPAQDYLTSALLPAGQAKTTQRIADLGPEGMLLDTSPGAKGVAQGLAHPETQNSPAATSMVIDSLNAREAGKNTRVRDKLDSELGPAVDPQMLTDRLKALRSDVHKDFEPLWQTSPQVDASAAYAVIGQKLNSAAGAEKAVLQRALKDLREPPLFPGGPPRLTTSGEKIHSVKMDLDKSINYGDPTLGVVQGSLAKKSGTASKVRGELNEALRDQVPGYGSINDRSSAIADVMDAIEHGKEKVLAGGPSGAISPTFHRYQFDQLSPAAQLGEKVGTRGLIDAAVGVKPNDLVAARSLMQGENGWNAQKLATQHGAAPIERANRMFDAEHEFGQSVNDVVANSATAHRLAMAKALQAANPPTQPLLKGDWGRLTSMGVPARIAQNAINTVHGAFRNAPDLAARDLQLARAVTSKGPDAQKVADQVFGAYGNQMQNASQAERLKYISQMLMGHAASGALGGPRRQQQ